MSVKGLNAAAPAVCAVWPVVGAGARLGTLALFKSSGALKLSGGKAAEGAVIASKVADRTGITRSVIVNALRKLKNAGIIESRSLGMKGTYIKVLNHILTEELNKLRG